MEHRGEFSFGIRIGQSIVQDLNLLACLLIECLPNESGIWRTRDKNRTLVVRRTHCRQW
jgi:hypothetical protein